jgi:uncharacterized repeat protein (TIGR03803 family)
MMPKLQPLAVVALAVFCVMQSPLAHAGKLTTLYSFAGGTQGYDPVAGLTYNNGIFYGTTMSGGASGNGTVFSLSSSGTETLLYSFQNSPDAINPAYKMIFSNGTLFGSTLNGGAYGGGTVFEIDSATGTESVLYSFGHHKDGAGPEGLVLNGGTLYGATFAGGAGGVGTLFAIDNSTGAEKLLHSFDGTDGNAPRGDLAYNEGVLYGITGLGGTSNRGTAFEFEIKSKQVTTLFSFTGGYDNSYMDGGVIYESGTLYGIQDVTAVNICCSNIYSIVAASGAETTLHNFGEGRNWTSMTGGLAYQDGILYGTSLEAKGCGNVYKFTISTGKYALIYKFHGADGCKPNGDVIYVNGALYGTTESGGANNSGTVFELKP